MSSRRYGIKVIYLSKVKEVSRNSTCVPGPPDVGTPGCFVYDNPCGPAKCKNYEEIRTGTIQNLGWTIDEGIAQELVDKTEAEETALYNSVLAAATAWKNSQVLYRETRNTESPWCTGHLNWLDERFYNYDFIILSGVNLTTSNKKILFRPIYQEFDNNTPIELCYYQCILVIWFYHSILYLNFCTVQQ